MAAKDQSSVKRKPDEYENLLESLANSRPMAKAKPRGFLIWMTIKATRRLSPIFLHMKNTRHTVWQI